MPFAFVDKQIFFSQIDLPEIEQSNQSITSSLIAVFSIRTSIHELCIIHIVSSTSIVDLHNVERDAPHIVMLEATHSPPTRLINRTNQKSLISL